MKGMKIVVLDGFTLNPGDLSWDRFKAKGECLVYDRTTPEELMERAIGAEVLITNKVVLDASTIAKLPSLRYIGVLATGYNVVDVGAAKKHGVLVTNIPAYSTDSVAQLVFAFILNFAQQVVQHSSEVKSGKWATCKDFSFTVSPQMELAGKTLGIVGFGKIGQKVAHIGKAFGMEVIFYAPSQKSGLGALAKQVSLGEVFKESDFVSINCPLTPENLGFVNASLLKTMKPGSFLVNTGRGPLINEADLAHYLNNNKIAGAGLDVLSTEPPQPDNPLPTAKNCYITPHIAWATLEARQRLMDIAVDNLGAYISGKPQNVVG